MPDNTTHKTTAGIPDPQVWQLARIALVVTAFAGVAEIANADFFLWDGGSSTTNDVLNSQNYSPDGAPPNNGTANIDFPDSPRPFPTAFQNWHLEGIIFSAASTIYDLVGAPISLGVGGVTNQSGRVQIIENDVVLTTPQFWVAFTNSLIQNGDVSGTLFLAGGEEFVFNGAMSGELTMDGEGKVTLAGNNDLSALTVSNGELSIDTNQPVQPGATISMQDGTTLSCDGVHSIGAFLEIQGTSTYRGNGLLTVARLDAAFGDTLRLDTSGELETLGGHFSGTLEVDRGTLVSNSAFTVFFRNALIGDGTGAANTAVLRTLIEEQISPGVVVEIREDGLLELQGSEEINRLRVTGGHVTGSLLTMDSIDSFSSSQTAMIDIDWVVLDDDSIVSVEDGPAEIDLDLAGDIMPFDLFNTLIKRGEGRLRLSGSTIGDIPLEIEEGSVLLELTAPGAQMQFVSMAEDTELTVGLPNHLGPNCALGTGSGATVNLMADQQVRRVFSGGVTIQGPGALEVVSSGGIIFDSGMSTIAVPLLLSGNFPSLESKANTITILTQPVVATNHLEIDIRESGLRQIVALSVAAPEITFHGNVASPGELLVAELLGDLHQVSQILSPDRSLVPGASSPQGELFIEGDWHQLGGELRIDINGEEASLDYDWIRVGGAANLEGTLAVVSLPGADYVLGDEYPIVIADSLSGSFAQVTLPPIGDDLDLEVEYDYPNATVYLNVVGTPLSTHDVDETAFPQGPIALRTFPNPFHYAGSSPTISYSVVSAGRVQVELFDVFGRRALSLLDQSQDVGVHQLNWLDRAGELPSGKYFVLVTSPGRSERASITVIR